MASPVALIGSKTMGLDDAPPTMIVAGSSDVYANGVAIAFEGSPIVPHKRGKHYHGGVVSEGSSTVFVNNMPVARVLDPISCGDKIADGSTNVECG